MRIDRKDIQKLIKSLNKYCFSAGLNKYLKSIGAKRLTNKQLKDLFKDNNNDKVSLGRCIHWSFKKTQKIVIDYRLKIEEAVRENDYYYEEPYTSTYVLKLLTDYADTLAWTMLEHDISAVRNFFLDYREITNLKNQNWPSIHLSLEQFNKNPNQLRPSVPI